MSNVLNVIETTDTLAYKWWSTCMKYLLI